MHKILARHCVLGAVAAICLSTSSAIASAGSFTRGCAARDMQVLMLIEARESAAAISTQKSTDAIRAIMHARMVCHAGQVLDALGLYDGITRSLEPVLSERTE